MLNQGVHQDSDWTHSNRAVRQEEHASYQALTMVGVQPGDYRTEIWKLPLLPPAAK